MEEGQAEYGTGGKPSDMLPAAPIPPLAVDESNAMEVDNEDDAHEKMGQDIERCRIERLNATRTLYHQRRADDDTINSTRSLYDSDVVYYEIHGRRYCGEYYMPNDEEEQTRMQMLHAVHLFLLGGRLTTAPLNNPTKILDIGTGCGDWAMGMGDEYPEAEVIGTDIAKIQPSAVPLNVFFEIDDAEEEGGWTYADDEFDLIHFRTMMAAFKNWNHIYAEAYKHLKPGGWIEVKDYDNHKDMLSFFPPGTHMEPWFKVIDEAAKKAGRPRGIAHLQHEMFTDLGFVDVSTEEYQIPMGTWPEEPEKKKIGKWFMIAQMCGIEALCLRHLTEQMGWTAVEIRQLCDNVANDIRAISTDAKRAQGLGFLVRVVKARKPFPGEQQDHDAESVSTMRNGENAQGQGEPMNDA